MRNRSYPVEVWNGQRTWVWCVADPCRKGGTIGAGPTKAEAVREAVLVNRAHVGTIECRCADSCAANEAAIVVAAWENSLADLERYLIIGAYGANE